MQGGLHKASEDDLCLSGRICYFATVLHIPGKLASKLSGDFLVSACHFTVGELGVYICVLPRVALTY